MNTAALLAYAARSLRRGGGRSLLAVMCVAFGVLSLVSMLLLADMVRAAMLVDPRLSLGGDLRLMRENRALEPADIEQLDAWAAAGVIERYTLTLQPALPMLRLEGSGRAYFLSRVLGVDAASFPLVGSVDLAAPATSLAAALASPDAAVVTRDLAAKLDLMPGDRITLGGGPDAAPASFVVTAVAQSLPDRRGDSILIPLSTARHLAPGQGLAASARVLTASLPDRFSGWRAVTPEEERRNQGVAPRAFAFALKGAGLLGLLVGGLGVANTLQVVLARRTLEIAVLKTLGYRNATLFALFAAETGLLGLAGALIGAAAALLVAGNLAHQLGRLEGSLLIEFFVDPRLVMAGVGIGLVTSVLFGLQAILRTATVRPATLLRHMPVRRDARTRSLSVGLHLLLLLACAGIGALVMGSALQGLGVIAAGIAGLLGLGLLHALLLTVLTRLPVPTPLFRLAQRNLRHRPVRALFAAAALFTGVFSIGYAGASLIAGKAQVDERRGSVEGVNLLVWADAEDEAAALGALREADATDLLATLSVPLANATDAGGRSVRIPHLAGYADDAIATIEIVEGEWTGQDDAILLLRPQTGEPAAAVGSVVTLGTDAGSRTFAVTGHYALPPDGLAARSRPRGAIGTRAAALGLAAEAPVLIAGGHVPPDRLAATAERLGLALPTALVVSIADVNALFVRAYEALFSFVIGIAGLALLAGAVLIANAVGLGMIERRREIGIFKAIGWTRRHVLGGVLLENGLVGTLAALTGMAAVALAVRFTNLRIGSRVVWMEPVPSLILAVSAIAIALGAAAVVAWRPTRVRPLVTLREE